MTTLLIAGLVLALLVDGLVTAARSVFSRIQYNRYLHGVTQDPQRGDLIQDLLSQFTRVDTSLSLFQMVSRWTALVLFLAIFWFDQPHLWSWLEILSLLGLAILITAIEWAAGLVVLYDPEKWMIKTSVIINLIYQVSRPLLSLLFLFSKKLEEVQKEFDQVSEEDLKSLVDESHKNGLLEEEEQKMIHSVFRLDDTLAREIMVPRIDIEAIEADVPFNEAIKYFVDSGFSRIPVYKDSVDNILGLLYAKDLLEICSNGTFQGDIAELTREAYFVPESKIINELLTDMQKRRVHLAIVVDEYGGVAGIVSLEDIIEEIFGEIQDEYDEEEGLFFTVSPGEYIFQGKIDIDDLNIILDTSLPNDEADTLGGLVYYHLGHVPMRGEVVKFDDLLIKVEQVDEHRIIKVRVKKLSNSSVDEEIDTNDPD
jgi:putative hemolysin